MFDLLSIVCAAAALAQGSCIPDLSGAQGERKVMPDAYEMRVAPGTYQLIYAASVHEYDVAALAGHWRRRAAQLCSGDYLGAPVSQVQYPDPGFETMTSFLPVAAVRTFNVEVYGVAYCADERR